MSDKETSIKKPTKGLLEKLSPLLLLAVIAMAFAIGALWQKVSLLQKGTGLNVNTGNTNTGAAQPATEPSSGKLSSDQAKRIPAVSDADHIRGSKDAKVILIEYSDYQCPFCSRFHPTAKQAFDEYKGDLAWVYRHFPLKQIHPLAQPAAEISECIFDLGGNDAFWKFTDAFYANSPTTQTEIFPLSADAGVKEADVKACFDAKKFTSKVDSQAQAGLAAGITGTPGNLIINQKGEAWLLPGAVPFETLKATIDEALK